MPPLRCPQCGETRRLGPEGLCAWRAGCEHRAMVAEARERELHAMIDQTVNHWSGGSLSIGGVDLCEPRWVPPVRPRHWFFDL